MLQFANPALLFAAALLAVPLIIHLLNRRQNKRRRWAAMEFLLRAYQKQRRRLRRENLLLLLLRCLIPIVLAIAIARPSLRDASALGLASGTAHHVFVFDRSYSMGLELPSGTTPFDRSKQLATSMIDSLAQRPGQKVSLVVSGLRPTMPIREDLNLARAKDRIASLGTPHDIATDLTAALLEVANLVEDSTEGQIRVYVLTDLQVRAFGRDPFATDELATEGAVVPGSRRDEPARQPPAGIEQGAAGAASETPDAAMFADSARDAIQRIQQAASLTVLDVRGSGSDGSAADNLQVVDLRLGLPHAIARMPIPVHARILNRSSSARTVQATLDIDGTQPLRSTVEIEAGAEGEVTFHVTFRELGQRRVRVAIEADDLATDDERFAVFDVRDRVRVLIVEGSNESEVDLRDSTHLQRILDPTGGDGGPGLTPFSIRTIDTVTFLSGREQLRDHDLIVLANVPRLNESTADALRAAVDGGAGLFVMLGDRVDVENYNAQFYGGGTGLLPMLLLDARGFAPGGDRFYGSEVLEPAHPVFADFGEAVYFEIFESLPIYRFLHAEIVAPTDPVEPAADPSRDPDPAEGPDPRAEDSTRILASVRDPARSPLLVAREFGRGKALFLTSALHRRPERWNGLDFEVVAFPLLHQIAHWLALPSIDPFNVEVGASLSAIVDRRPLDLAAVLPERAGLSKVPIGDEARPRLGGTYVLPAFAQTEFAGFYAMEMEFDLGGGRQREDLLFAVSPDVAEGDLRYYSHAKARERLGIENISADLPGDGEAAVRASFSEFGPLFLWLTLAFVLGEAAMARWIARRRT